LSSIGDIILTTHLLRCIRNKFPYAKIDFLTFDNFIEILDFNPRINNLYFTSKDSLKSSKVIIESSTKNNFNISSYDLIIDLQKNKYSRRLTADSNCQILKINKQRLHKLSLVYFKKPLINNFSIPQNYFSTARGLEIEDDGLGLEFWFENEIEYTPYKKNKSILSLDHITIAPGAAHRTKQLPIDTIINLLKILHEKYHCKFSLVGGKNEIVLGKMISENLNFEITNFCGKISLQKTAEIIDQSDLILTNDTGLMHIAAARQTPIISFWGSSVKDFGFQPFRTKYKIIEEDLWCRPCSHIGRSFCPLGHFKCMKQITVTEILESITELIQKIN
jgi:heptosyltransferase-2